MSLRPDRMVPLLRGSFGRTDYLYAQSCPSTQRLPGAEAAHGTVAVAEHQTEGRGRLGRVWLDAPGKSLLVSIVLRPRARPVSEWSTWTLVAGEAAATAIEAIAGRRPQIKLPNDLLLEGRKVAGILAEADGTRIVLGVGINVAGTPYEGAAALGDEIDRAELLAELLLQLERAFTAWDGAATGSRPSR